MSPTLGVSPSAQQWPICDSLPCIWLLIVWYLFCSNSKLLPWDSLLPELSSGRAKLQVPLKKENSHAMWHMAMVYAKEMNGLFLHLVNRIQQRVDIGGDNSAFADLPHCAAMLFSGVHCCNFLDKLAIRSRWYLHNWLTVTSWDCMENLERKHNFQFWNSHHIVCLRSSSSLYRSYIQVSSPYNLQADLWVLSHGEMMSSCPHVSPRSL